MEFKLIHNIKQNRVEALNETTLLGYIEYDIMDNVLDITHTIVLPDYSGQGIAGNLNKYILDYAKVNNLRVVASCSYTEAYIKRHPEYLVLTKR